MTKTVRNLPRLAAVNIQCPICGDGEQCRGWTEIKETVARLQAHFQEKHKNLTGVIIPPLKRKEG